MEEIKHLKLLIGNGAKVEVYNISGPIYEVEAGPDGYLGLHGFEIMEDDEAREFLEHIRNFGKGRNLVN